MTDGRALGGIRLTFNEAKAAAAAAVLLRHSGGRMPYMRLIELLYLADRESLDRTGEPIVGEEGYVGLDVHRATRIGSAGHGGQILLSEATRQRIEPRLPLDAALHRLAEFILKGLPGLESISQLTVPDLPSAFPPLRLETPARAGN